LSELLWGFLGGIILFAWRKQRRIPEPTDISAANERESQKAWC